MSIRRGGAVCKCCRENFYRAHQSLVVMWEHQFIMVLFYILYSLCIGDVTMYVHNYIRRTV